MPPHAESDERQRHLSREEDSPQAWWDLRKGILHTSDNDILENRCVPKEGWSLFSTSEVPYSDNAKWQLYS